MFNFRSRRLAMINKNRENFQYRGGDLVYIISPLTSQLRTNSWKIAVKYVGPVVVYKIIDPHNYLLMTLDGIILKGIFEHERLKPTIIRTSQGNVQSLAEFKTDNEHQIETRSIFFIFRVIHGKLGTIIQH